MKDSNNDKRHLVDGKTLDYVKNHTNQTIENLMAVQDKTLGTIAVPYTLNIRDSVWGDNLSRVTLTFLVDEKKKPDATEMIHNQFKNRKFVLDLSRVMKGFEDSDKISLDHESDL